MRTLSRALLALVAATLTLLPLGSTAHAADIYRYWGFYLVENGQFSYAQEGPGTYQPQHGSLVGFRYAGSAPETPNFPRADLSELTFDSICSGTEPADGEKLVAVLVDYGVPEDAEQGAETPEPQAGCAQVAADATAQQALQTFAEIRTGGGFLCAIDGYPAQGCADQKVDTATPADGDPVEFAVVGAAGAASSTGGASAASADNVSTDASPAPQDPNNTGDDGSGTLLYVGFIAFVVLLVVGGIFLLRQRRK